jgi:hypothetical protein
MNIKLDYKLYILMNLLHNIKIFLFEGGKKRRRQFVKIYFE